MKNKNKNLFFLVKNADFLSSIFPTKKKKSKKIESFDVRLCVILLALGFCMWVFSSFPLTIRRLTLFFMHTHIYACLFSIVLCQSLTDVREFIALSLPNIHHSLETMIGCFTLFWLFFPSQCIRIGAQWMCRSTL